ncbi:MAG: C40 family peptidase [Thermomicrobiales bacterium]|nr:C40 family peptidase [Thermomicrobiales bacterium]
MSGPRILAQTRRLSLSLVLALCISLLGPLGVAFASTDLTSGDDAIIVDANGDTVRLRSKPGLDGAVIAEFAEGTAVRVLDGPRISDDGEAWYRVHVGGETGYMAAVFLAYPGESQAAPVEQPEAPSVPDNAGPVTVTGTATIVNTNGDVIRCRAAASTDAAILAHFTEGMSVDLAGMSAGGWQPVLCEGGLGWILSDYIGFGGVEEPAPDDAPESELVSAADVVAEASVTGTGTVAGTNGDGVRCRSKASTSATIITTLAEGAAVDLRGDRSGDWQPVYCSGKSGYAWAEYIAIAGNGGGTNNGGSNVTGAAVIANTDGQGLRCRKKASFEGEVLTVLTEGTEVELRGAKKGDWQPIYCAGKKGYVHAEYVAEGGNGGNSGGGGGAGGGSTSGLKAGDTAQVSGTNNQGVRLRSAANSLASVITVLSEGTTAAVRSGSTGDWVAVTFRGSDGFIHKDFLVRATGGDSGGGNEPGGTLATGERARVTSSLNFRAGPSTSSDVLGVAVAETVVLIAGSAENGFYPVEWGDLDGYMHGDYLVWTDKDLTPGTGAGVGGVVGDAGNGTPSAVGRQMVDYAMNYLGYDYVWATAGPTTFDCSGFTYWVTKHVLGQDIGRGLWTQVVAGTPVSYGSLKPGDIVFFQNTYTWGLSHVGIYIGNNQFIHAENEDTGVRISSITSTYYSTRYYGAVRLG